MGGENGGGLPTGAPEGASQPGIEVSSGPYLSVMGIPFRSVPILS